jgi:hypothetical protein
MLGSGQQPDGPVTHYQKHNSKADHVLCVPNETKVLAEEDLQNYYVVISTSLRFL